jgi:hypothetical protein
MKMLTHAHHPNKKEIVEYDPAKEANSNITGLNDGGNCLVHNELLADLAE